MYDKYVQTGNYVKSEEKKYGGVKIVILIIIFISLKLLLKELFGE